MHTCTYGHDDITETMVVSRWCVGLWSRIRKLSASQRLTRRHKAWINQCRRAPRITESTRLYLDDSGFERQLSAELRSAWRTRLNYWAANGSNVSIQSQCASDCWRMRQAKRDTYSVVTEVPTGWTIFTWTRQSWLFDRYSDCPTSKYETIYWPCHSLDLRYRIEVATKHAGPICLSHKNHQMMSTYSTYSDQRSRHLCIRYKQKLQYERQDNLSNFD